MKCAADGCVRPKYKGPPPNRGPQDSDNWSGCQAHMHLFWRRRKIESLDGKTPVKWRDFLAEIERGELGPLGLGLDNYDPDTVLWPAWW